MGNPLYGQNKADNLIDEAADTFDAVNQSVDLLANKLTGKKKKAVTPPRGVEAFYKEK